MYEPLGRREDSQDRRSLFDGAEPPFVGRERELTTLRSSLDQARRGAGHVVTVRGAAGAGKTRLTLELRRQVWEYAPEVRWAYARSASYGSDGPYAVLRQLLNDLLGVRSRETLSEARWRVIERTSALFPDPDEAQAVCALLGDALGLSFPLPWVDQLEPQHRHRLFLERLEMLAARLAAEAPLALVVDDAQWMDPASAGALAHLGGALGGLSVWLTYLMRNDDGDAALVPPAAQMLTLGELGDVERAELMEALLAGHAAAPGVRSAILEKTGGNPFFIEEVVRSLAEQGALIRSDMGPRSGDPPAPLPPTVQGVVLARLDRLDDGARRVLQVASVIGRLASAPLLREVVPFELSAGAARSDAVAAAL
ncbi:MAG: AAA family ATPase, partial [Chloroflexi bacterium]|nr:AAA family ATPase [Chloroflexota bacterium]